MRPSLGALALVMFASLTVIISSAQQPGAESAPAIRLKGAAFRPTAGEQPNIPPGLAIDGYAETERGYYLVQFAGPIEDRWKSAVVAQGAELLDYVPDFAFKVRMNPAEAARVAGTAGVAWVGLFHPAYKLSPDVRRNGRQIYEVRIERGANPVAAAVRVAAAGAQVLRREGLVLTVAADGAALDAVAHVLDVASVRNQLLPRKHNDEAGRIIGAPTAHDAGYLGVTQTVAVADTGLGGGTAATAHADISSSRITAIYNWPGVTDNCWSVTNDGAVDLDSGHGTHTAASVLSASSGAGKGVAPAARLVFQAVENWAQMKGLCALAYPSGYYLTGLPADLRQLFQQAYTAGARIHSNSWGSSAAGSYTAYSANADDFVWTHGDMAITFSAGNDGIDANGDGVIDLGSMGAPATAKNVISVGASENAREDNYRCDITLGYTNCTNQNGLNALFTYGAAWPADYPANPIRDDASAGSADQMAAFSSRGPTDDGRIKPDVVAPGTWVLSGYSDLYQQGYDTAANPKNNLFQYDGWGFPFDASYKYMGGTSMSNPLVAGAAAVVRDYYQTDRSVAHPTAALVKATLINTATDLMDENNDGADDNDLPIPNAHEGWGRVNVGAATSAALGFVEDTAGLATGANRSYAATATGGALKITLVWSDYPSNEAAAVNLVNDLDLEVTASGGTLYRGNVFSSGWSASGGSADRRNNVENVYVPGAGGEYTILVRGFNVPQGPQRFALVVSGGTLAAVPPPPPPPPGSTAHVGDLDASVSSVKRNWQATVSVTVHDASENVLAGAVVTGTWAGGASGTVTCTTNAAGTCSVASGTISAKKTSATFTVTGVSASGFSYNAANHDPDGDSNGSSIAVVKP
jgi:subtilisin family serine protease